MRQLSPTGTVLIILISFIFFRDIRAARYPLSVDDAQHDYPRRRDDLIEVFADLARTEPLEYTVYVYNNCTPLYPGPMPGDPCYCIPGNPRSKPDPRGICSITYTS